MDDQDAAGCSGRMLGRMGMLCPWWHIPAQLKRARERESVPLTAISGHVTGMNRIDWSEFDSLLIQPGITNNFLVRLKRDATDVFQLF